MEEIKNYVNGIKVKFKIEEIKGLLEKPKDLKVLAIGDIILDQYVFVIPKGRAIKDPILSTEFLNKEIYAGGILAIANHLSDFVKEIKLVSLIGDRQTNLDFINNSLGKNIQLKTFVKKNSPTNIKRRYIDPHRNNKLFKVEYINDNLIEKELEKEIIEFLDEELPKYDLVVVGDFGHGFINDSIRRVLESKSKFLALNVQSNSANLGFNYFNLYNRIDFITLNEDEIRLPFSKRFTDMDPVMMEMYNSYKCNDFLVTRGKKGCVYVDHGRFFKAPILINSVKDTIGAGDALYAISSLLVYLGTNNELTPFIANCGGGILANILGNKECLTKDKLLKFIKGVYENGMGRI